jgi:hypothetical protein
MLPLCYNAIATWRAVDGRAAEGFSPLAAASVRALVGGLTTAILARDGGDRWCEFTIAPPAAASTFARLYPGTRFLIVHRRADAVIRAILDANRWGLAGSEFVPFVSASPGSTSAALAGYWAAHAAALLEFEQAHPGSCLRVRIEDVRTNTEQAIRDIGRFLGLDNGNAAPRFEPDQAGDRVAELAPAGGLPLAQIPAVLLAQLNDLHRRLGYPPVSPSGS